MAKKGMKNWFGFGKKEADKNESINEVAVEKVETHDNDHSDNTVADANTVAVSTTVDNANADSAVADSSEVDSPEVDSNELDSTTTDNFAAEQSASSESDIQDVDNTELTEVDEQNINTEQASEPVVDDATPKWYQFGKKKQAKLAQEQKALETDVLPSEVAVENNPTDIAEQQSEEEPVISEVIPSDEIQPQPELTPETVAEVVVDTNIEVDVQQNENIEKVEDVEKTEELETSADTEAEQPKEKFFSRLKRGLSRTKGNIGSGFKNLFRGKHIDDDLFEELEEQLLIADLGVTTTTRIIDNLTQQASRKELKDADALYDILKKEMAEMLHKVDQPLEIDTNNKPHVILMVGVNGVGKTTTIGKMAKKFQAEGKSVMLAAGDTFRAAAVEQLQVWGERNQIPVVAQHTGADSASVLFDAMQSATAKDVDVLIADTAGRLQNKDHLMEELKKVVRVMRKHDATAPHEIMLTIDAGTGQNALSQAELFKEAVGLTGITLTKLDGTAKGGVIFAVADKFEIPIRFIGIGEGIDDLRTFNSEDFIDALFSEGEA